MTLNVERQEVIDPVQFSTNPFLRVVLRDEIENPLGARLLGLPEELIEVHEWSGEHDPVCLQKRDASISAAVGFILFVQIPAGIGSFAASPTTEWEIIGGCFFALLALKVVVAKTASVWAVVLGAAVANVLMGALVGEVLHFAVEATSEAVGLSAIGGAVAALLLVAAFYLCLVGDGMYVVSKQRVKIKVLETGEKVVVTESASRLSARERWWLVWGLSSAPFWSPFHTLYLMCRAVDWLTAVWMLLFQRSFRRR